MNLEKDRLEAYQHEIDQAQSARRAGREGMARVCARRAAGILIAEYLKSRGELQSDQSAYELIKTIQSLPGVSSSIHRIASHLLLRVNEDRTFPGNVDLIAETRRLANEWFEISEKA